MQCKVIKPDLKTCGKLTELTKSFCKEHLKNFFIDILPKIDSYENLKMSILQYVNRSSLSAQTVDDQGEFLLNRTFLLSSLDKDLEKHFIKKCALRAEMKCSDFKAEAFQKNPKPCKNEEAIKNELLRLVQLDENYKNILKDLNECDSNCSVLHQESLKVRKEIEKLNDKLILKFSSSD
jgi:hypothetical protein